MAGQLTTGGTPAPAQVAPVAKKWYTSKTIWVNVIAFATLIAQTQTGFIIDPTEQGAFLTGELASKFLWLRSRVRVRTGYLY